MRNRIEQFLGFEPSEPPPVFRPAEIERFTELRHELGWAAVAGVLPIGLSGASVARLVYMLGNTADRLARGDFATGPYIFHNGMYHPDGVMLYEQVRQEVKDERPKILSIFSS